MILNINKMLNLLIIGLLLGVGLFNFLSAGNPKADGFSNDYNIDLSCPISYNTDSRAIQSVDIDIVDMIQQMNVSLLLGYLENITSFGARYKDTEPCRQTGKYIYNEFLKMGLNVRYDNFSYNWINQDYNGSNIVATIKGCDTSSDQVYIICAHYDTVEGTIGADDNGAAVAGILSMAKIMRNHLFNHTIRFIAFDAEEGPGAGSYSYASEAYDLGENIVGVMNADMIGYTATIEGENKISVFYDIPSEWLFHEIKSKSQAYYDHINIHVNDGGYQAESDHYMFWQYGFTAVLIHEYEFNPYWHKPGDTIENMNPTYATKVSKLLMAALSEISELKHNSPPNQPAKPTGPKNGKIGKEYTYTTSSFDPDDDEMWFQWDWGNGTYSEWIGPYTSRSLVETSYTWQETDEYRIRVKARDIYGDESDWSDPLEISMSKRKESPLFNLFEWLIERFPYYLTYFFQDYNQGSK